MNELLVSGYMAYTSAAEYGSEAASEAPATPSSPACVSISVASFAASAGHRDQPLLITPSPTSSTNERTTP